MKLRNIVGNRAVQAIVIALILGIVFVLKARQNLQNQDYINTNFFSFWLSGHMAWTGESPYDSAQFLHGFDVYGATYRPSKILQYPLPLMYFMAPIGLLEPGDAYFAWQLVCLVVIALTAFLLLWRDRHAMLLAPLIALAMLYFGPVYLSLQVGSVGPIALLSIALALVLLRARQPLLAGMALSLLFLKPPQALTLMALAGLWFLMRREWKAIIGIGVGGAILLAGWLLRDPQGLAKFRGSSDFLLGHTMGVQSNVFSFAFMACRENITCMWVSGWIATAAVIALGAWLLWTQHERWDDWQAFNVIIPLGFVSAVYLWSYDQLLYVVPIIWIGAQLLHRRRGFLAAIAFLVVIDILSFYALAMQAATHKDLLSILTTVVILGMCLMLGRSSLRSAGSEEKQPQMNTDSR